MKSPPKRMPPDARLAEQGGMSDETVRTRTGRDWKEWVRLLDAIGAASMPHREIARSVHESYGIPGWWAQTVTVGYERIRGLREIGQRRDSGRFDANKSKTFNVPVGRLYRALAVKRTRERWLPGVEIRIRTSIADRSLRLTWPDNTAVHACFTAKGPQKSLVAIQHVGLSDRKELTARKEYWTSRLKALEGIF